MLVVLCLVFFSHCGVKAQSADSLTVVFTGDILLDRGVRKRIEYLGLNNLVGPKLQQLFKQSHYIVGNLECPQQRLRNPFLNVSSSEANPNGYKC